MSNKTDLQSHNVDLQTIKQFIADLPTSVPWGGSNIIVPGTQSIAIPAYTDTELTVQGDANLIAGNILSGKSIFGVAGNVVKGVDADIGVITLSSSSTSVTLPTTKKRSKLIISSCVASSSTNKAIGIASADETTAYRFETSAALYPFDKITITFNTSNITLRLSSGNRFDVDSLYYCAYN